MKKIPFILLGITLLLIIIFLCFSSYYGLEYISPMISITAVIANLVFLTVITYCVIGIYINGKKK